MARAGGDPRAVDEHRRDVEQVIPWHREVAVRSGPTHDPAHRGRGHTVAGLGEKLCGCASERKFGSKLRSSAGEAR